MKMKLKQNEIALIITTDGIATLAVPKALKDSPMTAGAMIGFALLDMLTTRDPEGKALEELLEKKIKKIIRAANKVKKEN